MVYLRNPFKIRASEHISPGSDTLFLELFGSDILTLNDFKERDIWEKLVFIESSPGGGKTTLLRLLTPTILNTLFRHRTNEHFKPLFNILKEIGVIDNHGPKILGVYIPFSRTYSSLENLDIDDERKRRFLFSLLNSRITLTTLRSIADLYELKYPEKLDQISFLNFDKFGTDFNIKTPITGKALYDWARQVEYTLCQALDSVSPELEINIHGHNELFFDLIHPSNISIDGNKLEKKLIILFDDFNKLDKTQRDFLYKYLVEERISYGIWVAERTEVLDLKTMLQHISHVNCEDFTSCNYLKPYKKEITINNSRFAPGAKGGRDYFRTINLEKGWDKKQKKFEKFVMNIADLRLRIAEGLNLPYFYSLFDSSLDRKIYEKKYHDAIETTSKKIMQKWGTKSRYKTWIDKIESEESTLREKAIKWRTLEIIIERDVWKNQQTLTDLILSEDALENRDDPSIKPMAEFYLANEFNFPYYFGIEMMARAAHLNVEQFLLIAGEEFEAIRGKYRIKKDPLLTPAQQEKVLKKAANKKWDELIDGVSYSLEIKWFLQSMGKFLVKETFNPRASYNAVTGVGIKARDIDLLNNPAHKKLKFTLETCVANSLLVPKQMRQGGEEKIVFYLNRLLCIKFNLPLALGGWRQKKLSDLEKWIEGIG